MIICLSGKLQVLPNDGKANADADFDQAAASSESEMFVTAEDREPMIGIAACLSTSQWRHVRNKTDGWSVKAIEYTDTIWFSRRDVMRAFRDTWPAAQDDMIEVAHYHYEVDDISPPDPDHDHGIEELSGTPEERLDHIRDNVNERVAKMERNIEGKLKRIEEAVVRLVNSA